jgi:hypothetical protein
MHVSLESVEARLWHDCTPNPKCRHDETERVQELRRGAAQVFNYGKPLALNGNALLRW